MISATQFINDRIGHEVDVDGAYGAQCWDLFAFFCKQADWPIFHCTTTGYVKDLWNNRNSSGILNYFKIVNAPQKGDWTIWNNCAACPLSHIAMFVSDNNNGTGKFLGQNQEGYGVTIKNFPYAGVFGYLRPKCYVYKIGYQVHMKDIGWGAVVYDGTQAGTTGQSRRIEALKINPFAHNINAKAHIQNIGWKDYGKIYASTVIGTTGQSLRLEALCLNCTDAKLEYRVHVATEGWSAWTLADGIATLGTVGMKLAIEAIQIKVA